MPARGLTTLAALLVATIATSSPTPDARADELLVGELHEQSYSLEIIPSPERTTYEVTRTFFNPTLDHQRLQLWLDIPSDAVLDGFAIAARDPRGELEWAAAGVEPSHTAGARYESALERRGDAAQGDMIAVLSRRDGVAKVDLHSIPPLHERSIRYRVHLPTDYESRYVARVEPRIDATPSAVRLDVSQLLGFSISRWDIERSPMLRARLEFTPRTSETARASLAAIDLGALGVKGQPVGVIAAQLELSDALVELPRVRRVVLIFDGSRSVSTTEREALVELAADYLETLGRRWPDASAAVLSFDRDVHEMTTDFEDPSSAGRVLDGIVVEGRNGSEIDRALAHARALLERRERLEREAGLEQAGVDWIVVFSDLALRSHFSHAAELEATSKSDARVHVVSPARDPMATHMLTPAAASDAWMAIAATSGGAHFRFERDAEVPGVAAELLEPTQAWHLRAHHTDASGARHEVELASVAHAGTRTTWLARLDARPGTRVDFEATTWAGDVRWSATTSTRHELWWAGVLAGGVELPVHELAALADYAGVASPWTSLVAELPIDGVGPRPAAQPDGEWIPARSGRGDKGGGGGSTSSPRPFTLDPHGLRRQLLAALDPCSEGAEVEFELLDTEIVAVTSSDACAREAMWALDLGMWPLAGRREVRVAHGHVTSLAVHAPPE